VHSRRCVPLVLGILGCATPLAAQYATSGPPRLAGYVQARFQSIGDSALFLLRRARIGAQGTLTPWASVKVQAELRSGGTGATAATVTATDLYVALSHREWSGAVGQFKTPFSREFMLSSTVLELADRPLVVDALVPNRDVGMMAQWEQAGRVTVQGGIFNGEGINRARNTDNRMLYIGRLIVTPTTGVDVGGAVAAASDSTRVDVELGARRGAWTLRAEYLQRHRHAPADEARGWYALAAYTVRPQRLQLAGRAEQFEPGSAPGNRATAYTGGLQWFFRGDDLKLLASYGVFIEQGPSIDNNRLILQLQARF
jgi:phosphate-selective porin OprO and OprP